MFVYSVQLLVTVATPAPQPVACHFSSNEHFSTEEFYKVRKIGRIAARVFSINEDINGAKYEMHWINTTVSNMGRIIEICHLYTNRTVSVCDVSNEIFFILIFLMLKIKKSTMLQKLPLLFVRRHTPKG